MCLSGLNVTNLTVDDYIAGVYKVLKIWHHGHLVSPYQCFDDFYDLPKSSLYYVPNKWMVSNRNSTFVTAGELENDAVNYGIHVSDTYCNAKMIGHYLANTDILGHSYAVVICEAKYHIARGVFDVDSILFRNQSVYHQILPKTVLDVLGPTKKSAAEVQKEWELVSNMGPLCA